MEDDKQILNVMVDSPRYREKRDFAQTLSRITQSPITSFKNDRGVADIIEIPVDNSITLRFVVFRDTLKDVVGVISAANFFGTIMFST
ncbi:MAG: hypothetical protein AAFU54_23300 [Chloroflexota bacterium]